LIFDGAGGRIDERALATIRAFSLVRGGGLAAYRLILRVEDRSSSAMVRVTDARTVYK
jgi:hypothetical protein